MTAPRTRHEVIIAMRADGVADDAIRRALLAIDSGGLLHDGRSIDEPHKRELALPGGAHAVHVGTSSSSPSGFDSSDERNRPGAPHAVHGKCTTGGAPPAWGPDPPSATEAAKGPPGRLTVTVPLHLAPVGNKRECWQVRDRRVRRERLAVHEALDGRKLPELPITVELHRVGWNYLDADGCVGACKVVIDEICAVLGVDDRDRRLHWRLSQGLTRATRFVTRGRHSVRVREVAAELRIAIRPWARRDGRAAILVAPTPEPKSAPKKGTDAPST